MHWVIQKCSDGQAIATAAASQGHSFEWADPKPNGLAHVYKRPALLYATIESAQLHETAGTGVSIWATWANYACTRYFPRLGNLLLNEEYAIWPVAELKRLRWLAYRMFAKDTKVFVRPNEGTKSFTGQLLDLQDFDRFWDNPDSCAARPDDLVIVSKPQSIRAEWRCFVSATEGFITGSLYRYQGNITIIPAIPPQVKALATEVWKRGDHPNPMYCIDIAELEATYEHRWRVIEINSFSTAGIYAADPKRLVQSAAALFPCT